MPLLDGQPVLATPKARPQLEGQPTSPVGPISSGVAVVSGALAAALEADAQAGRVALIVAIGGLVTAGATAFTPMWKTWLEHRRIERKEAWERHQLADKLNEATLKASVQAAELDAQRKQLIDLYATLTKSDAKIQANEEEIRELREALAKAKGDSDEHKAMR